MSDGVDKTAAAGQKNGKRTVVTVDQEWPLFTVDGNGPAKAAPEGDQTPNVTAVLRDVLGWRPVPQDSKAFVAALTASFDLTEVEGHVESRYRARGFSMQADLGAVSGGQASLYARAKAGLTHMLELLDGLTPLRPDFDVEDGSAARSLVRTEINRIVDEVGTTGGPRTALVDASFVVLLGESTAGAESSQLDDLTGDTVSGQLGRLRDVFGLVDGHVNTVEEERVRTSYWTLVDEVLDLRRAWAIWSTVLRGGTTGGFLGTDLVLISRLMEAASEQVDEYEDVLDSVLIGGADRQTTWLDRQNGLTLQGLLDWTRQFLRVDGPAYLNDSGRDGLSSAFLPMIRQLEKVYADTLIGPVHSKPQDFPPGLSAARSIVALTSLVELIDQLGVITAGSVFVISPEPLEVTIWPLQDDGSGYYTSPQGQVRIPYQAQSRAVPDSALVEADRRESDARRSVEETYRLHQDAVAQMQTQQTIVAKAYPRARLEGLQAALDKAREDLKKAIRAKAPDDEVNRYRQDEAIAAAGYTELAKLQHLKQRVRETAASQAAAKRELQAASGERRRIAAQRLSLDPVRRFLLSVRVAYLGARLLPAFDDGVAVVVPDPGSDTTNDDTVNAVFAVTDQKSPVWALLDSGEELVFSPNEVPLVLLDAATGERVWPPAGAGSRTWPTSRPATWPPVTAPDAAVPTWRLQTKYRNGF